MHRRALTLLLLSVMPLARCSLLGLDAFDLPRCTSNRDCDELNAERNVPSGACQRYQCVQPERQCRLTARDQDGDGDAPVMCGGSDCDDTNARRNGARAPRPLAETCDGLDNNCNDVVDEGVWLGAPVSVGTVPAPVATASASSRDDGRTGICTTTTAGVPSFSVLQGQRLETGAIRYEARIPGDGAVQQVIDRCPSLTPAGTFGLGTCNAVEVVAAPLDAGRWFVATLNTRGCAQGQVRVGWMAESDRHLVLDAVGSPIAAGIDVSPAESCTGASRTSPVRGAASLAITSIPAQGATPARALVTWLAVDRAANVCGETKVIEGVLVTLAPHRVTGGALVDAVVPLGDGRPFEIGRTRGTGPTGVVALPTEGRFDIGLGDEEGRVALRAIRTADGRQVLGDVIVVDTERGQTRDITLSSSVDSPRLTVASMIGCDAQTVSITSTERIDSGWAPVSELWRRTFTGDPSYAVAISANVGGLTASDPGLRSWVLAVAPQGQSSVVSFARVARGVQTEVIGVTSAPRSCAVPAGEGMVLIAKDSGQAELRTLTCTQAHQ